MFSFERKWAKGIVSMEEEPIEIEPERRVRRPKSVRIRVDFPLFVVLIRILITL
jgi:hypothetical protein